jgi:hypothetical protein
MPASPADSAPTDRTADLERRVRWLTAVCVFLGAGLVLVYARPFFPTLPDLKVRSLTVPDSAGTPRIQLATWRDGTPVVQLNDAGGRERIMLLVMPTRESHLHMADSTGQYRVVLELDAADRSALRLGGAHGAWNLALMGRGDGRPAIVARSEPGQDTLFRAP